MLKRMKDLYFLYCCHLVLTAGLTDENWNKENWTETEGVGMLIKNVYPLQVVLTKIVVT